MVAGAPGLAAAGTGGPGQLRLWLAAAALLALAALGTIRWIGYAPRHARSAPGWRTRVRRQAAPPPPDASSAGQRPARPHQPIGGGAPPLGSPVPRASPSSDRGTAPVAAASAPDPNEEALFMSDTRPDTATTPTDSPPQFPLALRGYDRQLVDARLADLAEQVERERQRRNEAEQALRRFQVDVKEGRAQVPAWFTNVGVEVDRVVEEAGEAAAKLLAEAGRRIQAAIDAAEAQAAERLKAAEEQASTLEQAARTTLADAQTERTRLVAEASTAAEEARLQADRDARALLAKANDEAAIASAQAARERGLLEAERERLGTLRQAMVDQLGQVYAPLGFALVDTRRDLHPSPEDGRQTQVAPAGAGAGPAGGGEPARPDAGSERQGMVS
jgi:hypothetical protein